MCFLGVVLCCVPAATKECVVPVIAVLYCVPAGPREGTVTFVVLPCDPLDSGSQLIFSHYPPTWSVTTPLPVSGAESNKMVK